MITAILGLALATATIEGQHPRDPEPFAAPERWIEIESLIRTEFERTSFIIVFEVDVGLAGQITGCTARDQLRPTHEEASPRYLARACVLLRQRVHFFPATDVQGNPIPGKYFHTIGRANFDEAPLPITVSTGRPTSGVVSGESLPQVTIPPPAPPPRTVPPPRPPRPPVVPPSPPPLPPPRSAVLQTDLGPIMTRVYGSHALREGLEGTVHYTVIVGPNGRVNACSIRESSGFATLDNRTCELLERYARFNPAIGERGTEISGTWSGTIEWRLPDLPPITDAVLQD